MTYSFPSDAVVEKAARTIANTRMGSGGSWIYHVREARAVLIVCYDEIVAQEKERADALAAALQNILNSFDLEPDEFGCVADATTALRVLGACHD